MDNNYYENQNNQNNQNNNGSSQSTDSFYSYNHGAGQNRSGASGAGQTAYGASNSGSYGAGATSGGYGTSGYGAGTSGYNGYGTNGYGANSYGANGYGTGGSCGSGYGSYGASGYGGAQTPKPEKKKREKKPGGFGKQLAKCAALALVFGLVAGGVMTGVNYAGSKALGITSSASLSTSDGTTVKTTAVSSTYAATGVSDIVSEVMPSIVAITNVSETEYQSFWGQSQVYESTSCGSGIIVSQDSEYLYIATNNHVVDGATNLTVAFCDEATVSAEIKGTDASTDLAVVKVALSDIESDTLSAIKVATLGDSDSLSVGESCIAIGNALGYGQSVTTGVISALNREVTVSDSSTGTSYTAELIQTDAAINPGNSGGALLNAAGEVIGINSVKYSDTDVEGIGYAIPMNTAKPIIEELITKEKVAEEDSSYLGIRGEDVTSTISQSYGLPVGIYVTEVVSGSPAEQAGIQKGDIITQFDGKTVSSMSDLQERMEYYAAGTTVDLVVQRVSNGQYVEQTITVTLGSKN